MSGGERFTQTARLADRERKQNGKASQESNELETRIARATTLTEDPSSAYEVARNYLLDNFASQASALYAAKENRTGSRTDYKSIFMRRSRFIENAKHVAQTAALSDIERRSLEELTDFGIVFLEFATKNLGLFYAMRGSSVVDAHRDTSNVLTSEAIQELAELIVRHTKEAPMAGKKGVRVESSFAEQTIFPLAKTILSRALGGSQGENLAVAMVQGSYGLAAGYLAYHDKSLNRFGKSFRVLMPSPYLDAMEQTDLLLVDDERIEPGVWEEIQGALNKEDKVQSEALAALSPEAKQRVYKVQIKCRKGGEGLTDLEMLDRKAFLSDQCKRRGFDNGDYLVFTPQRAKQIVERVHKEG